MEIERSIRINRSLSILGQSVMSLLEVTMYYKSTRRNSSMPTILQTSLGSQMIVVLWTDEQDYVKSTVRL